MNILKKILLGFAGFLFIILLFTTAFTVGFVRFATNPDNVKKVAAKSGIYDDAVPIVLQQAGSISTNRIGVIPLSDPGIQTAAKKAISAQYVQTSSENFIDSIYGWLNGKTREPNFTLDLSKPQSDFAENIGVYLKQKIDSLPPCQANVLPNPATLDVFNMTCKPQRLDSNVVVQSAKDEVFKGGNLVNKDSTVSYVTASQIGKNPDGKSMFQEQLKDVPKQYQKAKNTPFILSVLTILAAVAVVFLSQTWQKGLKHAGIILAIIGVLMLLTAWGLSREVNNQAVPKIKAENLLLQKDLRNLATDLTGQISKNYWFFGGLYTAFGVGMIVGGEAFHRRAQPKHQLGTTEPEQEAPKDETKPAEEPKRPKPKKVKIQ